jgi:hypothetical protein
MNVIFEKIIQENIRELYKYHYCFQIVKNHFESEVNGQKDKIIKILSTSMIQMKANNHGSNPIEVEENTSETMQNLQKSTVNSSHSKKWFVLPPSDEDETLNPLKPSHKYIYTFILFYVALCSVCIYLKTIFHLKFIE